MNQLLITIVLLMAAGTTFAQRDLAGSRLSDLREIEQLETEWNRINEVSDVEGFERLLAEDSYHVGPSGRLYTKSQDIEAQLAARNRKLGSGANLRFIISDQKIKIFKNVAVVTATGRSVTTHADGTKNLGNSFRSVHVWEKRDGRWLLTVDQVTRVGH
jgi:uncharacterized protein (TIGR02246 family)